MALTPEEQAMLDALSSEAPASAQKRDVANSRQPSDLQHIPMSSLSKGLNPDEEAMLEALNTEPQTLPQNTESASVGQKIMNGVSAVGDFVDSYTGAPTRQAINTLADTGNPIQAVADFGHQFGADPNLAPTGKELATKAGFSTENQTIQRNPMQVADEARAFNRPVPSTTQVASPAAVAGFGIDVAADPMNLIPLIPFGKIATKTGQAAKTFLKGSAKAADIASGTQFVKAGETASDVARLAAESTKESKKSLVKLFRPDVNPDFKDYARIAEENNIPKELLNEAHEFGENSIISRHARGVAEGPLGAEKMKKHEDFMKAVSNATENKIKQFGQTDKILDNADAGELIKHSFNEGVDRFFKGMGETYQSALQVAPDMRLDKKSHHVISSDLNKMEMWAKKRLGHSSEAEKIVNNPLSPKRQVTSATNEMFNVESSINKAITPEAKAQAKEVLEGVKLAKRALSSSGGDLNQVYSAMRDIGDIAFKKKPGFNALPADQKKFQEMYFSLQKGMTESVRTHLGDDFANTLIQNNSDMSKFFSKRSVLEKALGGDHAGEEVFNKLILKGDTKQLDTLFSIISPEAKNQLKSSFLNNVVSKSPDGAINFKTTRNKLNDLRKSGKLKELFTNDELSQLDDILKLGDGAGKSVLSTSGTGASNAFRDMATTLKNKVEGDILVEGMKKGARKRANFVENASASGKPKSGLQILRENSPITKRQASQGARVNSIQDRNSKLEQYKKMRGL